MKMIQKLMPKSMPLKFTWLMLSLLILLSITGCQKKDVAPVTPKAAASDVLSTSKINQDNRYASQQKALVSFLNRKMVQKQGIYTNVQATANSSEVATGHEMLSESSGFWLEYLAVNGRKKEFAAFYKATKKTFDQNGQQFSYRYNPNTQKKYSVNATLDDLRILRALVIYDAVNQTDKYKKEANQRFAYLRQNCILDGHLIDYYDVKEKQGNHSGALAYFDLRTLKYFESSKVYQRQLKVVKGGYLGDVFPLYAASFNWKTNQYAQKNLNTSEALETLLHLSEVGALKKTSRHWLAQQIQHQSLTNGYTINGVSVNNNQSSANYALAAMIFANVNDEKHYHQAMKIVWSSQIKNNSSGFNGGLSQAANKSYSFNNLTALTAAQFSVSP
ncbi:glycosyl hydrolase family 8 [Agrilactobacillus yilanensis]|uniref:Glycosyl hydrolase family 8 n=1 Tax=Agrilactobacillus yilanensis TaxID=2485997 RepID=A0ABW4J6D0_9LACO|nr:glycosyl hydrolase family 8 [Agrilactobacillus yilanensis]